MDGNKHGNKGSGRRGSAPDNNSLANLQQQMALASQLGLPPGLMDPSALRNMTTSTDVQLQQMLAMQASGLPFMDPGAALAFGGLAGMPPSALTPNLMAGSMGGGDWVAMAQQAQLLSALGAGIPPSMLPQLFGANATGPGGLLENKSGMSSHQNRGSSPSRKRPSSQSPMQVTKESSRPNSNASTSRLTPSGIMSTGPSNAPARGPSKSRQSTPSGRNPDSKEFDELNKGKAEAEQLLQREMLRQMEQQFMLQQMQLKQQKDQIQAALQAINLPINPSSSSDRRNQPEDTSQSDKLQQQLSQSIYQQLLAAGGSGIPGLSPMMPPYFGSPQAIEQLMGLNQLPTSSSSQAVKTSTFQPGSRPGQNKPLPGVPPHQAKTTVKKEHISPPDTKPRHSSDRKKSPAQGFFPGANSLPLSGDPNTDMFLAAIYDQMQLQGLPGSKNNFSNSVDRKKEDTGTSSRLKPSANSSSTDKAENTRQERFIKSEPNKDSPTLGKPASDTSQRRRKQANPTSISGLSESRTSSDRMKNGEHTDPSSIGNSDLSISKQRESSPMSLIKEKHEHKPRLNLHRKEINNSDASKLKSPTNDKSHSSSKPNCSTSGSITLPGGMSEKDLMAAMSFDQGKMGFSQSFEGMDKAILSAYNNLLASGQQKDLHKINELLTATVAAEMSRLQTQQINLTKELEMLKKPDLARSTTKPAHPNEPRPIKFEGANSSENAKQSGGKSGCVDSLLFKIKNKEEAHLLENGSVNDTKKTLKEATSEEEEAVLLPMKHDWKREVRIQQYNNELSGKVIYCSPDGKKITTFQDILKYLAEHGISDLQRSNFSFNSRLKVGTFFEQKGFSKEWTEIPEKELEHVWELMDRQEAGLFSVLPGDFPGKNRSRVNSSSPRIDSAKRVIEEKLRKEMEERKQLDIDMKLKQAMDPMTQTNLLRQQKADQQRIERDGRERNFLEERQKLEAARQLEKYQEAIRKTKEREQRRQHLLLLKSLETKRRAQERDRRKEEIKHERMYIRERKMEQRQMAMKLAREMKMPVEDMSLNNHQAMPELKPLQGTTLQNGDAKRLTQLSGTATADVLMVLEFLHTFKDAIFIDESVIPTLEQLQRGLLNDSEHIGSLVQLTMALLHQCLCDPGVPAPGPWLHCMVGIKVTDVDVGKENYSEILRLFLWARNGRKTETAQLLETEPFPALSPDQKASVLAFMVNELVCSGPICLDIEKHLDNLATLRRDKWVVEGKIRQARIEEANAGSDVNTGSPSKSVYKQKMSQDDDAEKDDSCKDDDSSTGDTKPTCRSDTLIQRKMKRLTKEHQSFNDRMYASSKPLRSLELGQDRYKRRYWVLSNLGGVYVEGLESGMWDDNEEKEEEEEEKEEVPEEKVHENPTTTSKIIPPATEATIDQSNLLCLSEAAQILSNMEKAAKSAKNQSNTIPCDNGKHNSICKNLIPVTQTATDKLLTNSHENLNNSNVKEDAPHNVVAVPTPSSTVTVASAVSQSLLTHPITQCTSSSVTQPTSSTFANAVQKSSSLLTSTSFSTNAPKEAENIPISTEIVSFKSGTPTSSTVPSAVPEETDHVLKTNVCVSTSIPTLSPPSINPGATSTTDKQSPTPLSPSPFQTTAAVDVESTKKDSAPDATKAFVAEPTNPLLDDNSSSVTYAKDLLIKSCRDAISLSSQTAIEEEKKTDASNETDVEASSEKKEDSVEAAARAIAAKAVASTSHLLFPQAHKDTNYVTAVTEKHKIIPEDSALSIDTGQEKLTLESVFESIPGLSKHMAKALQSIGMDPTNLSQQQLQALMHIKNTEGLDGFVPKQTKDREISKTPTKAGSSENKPVAKATNEQESPIDLSKPTSSTPNAKPSIKPTSTPPHIPASALPNIKPEPLDDPMFMRGAPFAHMFDPAMMMVSKYNPYIKAEFDRMHIPTDEFLEHRPSDVNKEIAPVPKELKSGWWRISSEKEFDSVCESLHSRGIREKHLQKSLMKQKKYCLNAIALSSTADLQFANDPELSKEDKETDEKSSSDEEDDKHDDSELDDDDADTLECPTETAYLIEMEALKQVEELSDRCQAAGILGQSWKPLPKASLTEDGLSHVPYQCEDDNVKHDWSAPIQHDPTSVLGFAVDLLTRLELSILRMYLKPPLIRKGGSSEFSSLPSLSEAGADVAAGMRTWRNAVATATSAAQLSMCVSMMESCIAWEKTIKCAVESSPKTKRRRGDKRSGKSPASGCTKKKRSSKPADTSSFADSEDSNPQTPVPDVDAAAPSKKGSGKKRRKEPHRQKIPPEGDCMSDDSTNNKFHDSPFSNEKDTSSCQDNESSHNINEDKSKKRKKKNKGKNMNNSDKTKKKKSVAVCLKETIQELKEHEHAAWFLYPVDLKAVPDYKKFIKKPMDLSSIEARLKRGKYKTGELFAEDVRVIFDNCQLFNEDDSPIGQAGHLMRAFFEHKWSELEESFDMSEEIP